MKTSVRITAFIIFLTFIITVPSAIAQADQLIGVWELTELVTTGPDARVIRNVHPMISFVNKKHMGILGFLSDTPMPELPQNPTDTQLVASLNSLWASAATYEADGDTVTLHNIVAKDPNTKPGDTLIARYRFEADTLVMTVILNKNVPLENPYTLKFSRLE